MDIIKVLTLNELSVDITEGVVKLILLNGEEVLESMYEYENGTLTFNEEMLGEEIEIHIYSSSKNLIGYRGDVLYKYTGTKNVLESSSVYAFDINIKDYSTTIEANSKFSPFHCKVRDVDTLIKPIIKTLKNYEEDLDIEYEIFLASLDIDTHFLDEDTDLDDDQLLYLIKLAAYRTAYNIVYRYYYSLSEEVGSFTKTVGTITETRDRDELVLSNYLARFERAIQNYEELINGNTTTSSFTKASNTSTGLNDRLWS